MTESTGWLAVVVGLVAVGCAAAHEPQHPPEQGQQGSGHEQRRADDVLVHGRVVGTTTATSYDEPVALGPDSVARIGLYSNPALGGDGDSTLIVEEVFSPAPAPPFEFELGGSLPDDSRDEQYHVMVEIKQHASTNTVGDLMSEFVNEVTPPAGDVIVEVQGLESCDAPNAGGFCL